MIFVHFVLNMLHSITFSDKDLLPDFDKLSILLTLKNWLKTIGDSVQALINLDDTRKNCQ